MVESLSNLAGILQTTNGGLLETEHALIMLLLLFGLLTFNQRPLASWVPLVILLGMGLSILTPVHPLELFWPWITGLVVPPLMWQAALAVTRSGPLRKGGSLAIWAAVLLGVAAGLALLNQTPVAYALLIGILAVTLVWYFRELKVERSYLSTIGLITLAVLLLEIDIALVSPRPWIGNLLSGIAFGIATGFAGIYLFRRLKPSTGAGFFIVLSYAAYLIGLAVGVSAIAVTMAAALVVATYGYSTRIWATPADIPAPAKTTFFFLLASGVWILLGWQAHTEPVVADLAGILFAMLSITLGIFVVRRWVPLDASDGWRRLARKEVRVFLLLIGASLYWPQEATLTALNVEVALVSAILLMILLREAIKPIFDLLGIKLSWPSEEDN